MPRAHSTQKVQIHWKNSPNSPSNPSREYQYAHDVEDLVHETMGDEVQMRMVDPDIKGQDMLRDDCLITIIVLNIEDTKLDNENANTVNKLLRQRYGVYLVLKGLTDGNIVRFGVDPRYANDVVVYDLDTFPRAVEPGHSLFDTLVNMIEARRKALFNDYPVDNFSILLQQRRHVEVRQEQRSWMLLLLSLTTMILAATVFMVSGHFAQVNNDIEVAELNEATVNASAHTQTLSSELENLEVQYNYLSELQEDLQFYKNSLDDDVVAVILGIGELELTTWDFEAEQYFMGRRVDEVNATVSTLCSLFGSVLSSSNEVADPDSTASWARFVSYCENTHSLQTCDGTKVADGVCHGGNNYRDCAWDGGDCCPGTYCLDGTHVCSSAHWYHLDSLGNCTGSASFCAHHFGYSELQVTSDGIDRYTPSCTEGKEATEIVFIAELPPGGLVEVLVEPSDSEVPIFVETYVVDDAYTSCPVANNGLAAGTGPYFQQCAMDTYVIVEGDANASVAQHAFIIVDIEDVTPMDLVIKWRNTSASALVSDGASQWARSQRCQIAVKHGLVGDGTCHAAYNTASCDWDGGDCRCTFGRPAINTLGDGTCDVRLLDVWTNTRSCGWDGGDCAVGNDIEDGGEVSNFDKPRFNNSEILDSYSVIYDRGVPVVLNISRHDQAPDAEDEMITLVAFDSCQEPEEWICPHEWYQGKKYVSFDEYYVQEVAGEEFSGCPASSDSLAEIHEHFIDGQAICDCGCGAVDPDCVRNGEPVDCENYANIDPLTLRFDPDAPQQASPDVCLCTADF